mgnify:FL=1
MREKRSFAERTRVLPNDEVKKKYFLVYEGKDTEAIYFEAVDVLKEHISINPLIEVIPVIRSYSEDGWSNPKKILDRMIQNIEELKSGEVSYETLLNWIMDYFQDYGILANNRPLAKSYWTTLQQICEEKLEVSLEEKVDNLQMACEMIFDILKEESKLENIVADIPRIINNSVLTYSEEIDKICLIVDRDKGSFTSAQYDYVVEQCENRNYGIYITNPCFEFWLLMHFDDVKELDPELLLENPKVSAGRRYCEQELKKRIPKYSKSQYDAIGLVRNVEKAIRNESLYCENEKELKNTIGSNVGMLIREMQK